MSRIISISLPEEFVENLDALQGDMGFSGRSDTIRAGLRLLLAERQKLSALKGTVDATLLVVHGEDEHGELSALRHEYEDAIKTQLHSHLSNRKCFEILVLHGAAKRVRALATKAQAAKGIDRAIFVPV